MTSAHWAWGILGGASLGWWYGDSAWEIAAGGFIGTPWGQQTIATSARAGARGAVWAGSTVAASRIGGAAWGAAGFGATAAAAVVVPVLVGGVASHYIGGRQGRVDYTEFMTGQVSPQEWWDAVTLSSMR